MLNRSPSAPRATRISSLHLDYGADSQQCADDAVEITERGMQLRSRWKFEIGTQLSMAFVCQAGHPGCCRLTAEALVVWCEPRRNEPGIYESTLLFLDVPEELKRTLAGITVGHA
jgi:hypothetical protein